MVSNTNSSELEELLRIAQLTDGESNFYFNPNLSDVENFINYFGLITTTEDIKKYRIPIRAMYKLYCEYKNKFPIHQFLGKPQFSHDLSKYINKSPVKKITYFLIRNSKIIHERIQDPYFQPKKKRKTKKKRSTREKEKKFNPKNVSDPKAWQIYFERKKRYEAIKETIIKSKSPEDTKS